MSQVSSQVASQVSPQVSPQVSAKAYFMVRSVVIEELRQKFDRWYSQQHLPMALTEFKCEKCWRFWSAADAGVHYAVYQFADIARLDAALKSDGFKSLVADYDKTWPSGVTRTRDMLTLAGGGARRLRLVRVLRDAGLMRRAGW
jgi:hypothetical protein